MDGVILGVSGWFTPHDVRYHEEARTTNWIALEDWSALLVHADAIGFFTRPEPPAATSDARIFHVTISAGDRSRELTVHDPYEAPELAMLDEQQLAALQAVGSAAQGT
jgi:hypothetical protein